MKCEALINADDLGITPGTNHAICEAFDAGYVNSASLIATGDYFNEALLDLKKRRDLKIGVHLNLTYGHSLGGGSAYSDNNGLFNLNYLQIIIKSIFNKKFLSEIYHELELQILKVKDNVDKIKHLDSHRHIHLIPRINKIVFELSDKYDIPRVRTTNESLTQSILITKSFRFLNNGGIIKFIVLKLFSIVNRKSASKSQNKNFYSILYTGQISRKVLMKIKDSCNIEVAVHPSKTQLDKHVIFYNDAEQRYRLSPDRERELAVLKK